MTGIAPHVREDDLARELLAAREYLLAAADDFPAERWSERPSPAYSPVGWHLGHVAEMQARWILGETQESPFDPFRTPKHVCDELPRPAYVRARLGTVLHRSLACLRGNLAVTQSLARWCAHRQPAMRLPLRAVIIARARAGEADGLSAVERCLEVPEGEFAIWRNSAVRAAELIGLRPVALPNVVPNPQPVGSEIQREAS